MTQKSLSLKEIFEGLAKPKFEKIDTTNKEVMKTVTSIESKNIKHFKANGLAYKETGKIVIDSRLKGFPKMETIIHEILHIQNKRWAEIKVEGHAKEIAELLWGLGYRQSDL